MTDHPRRCGENLSALFLMTACTGSPPQVRGKRCADVVNLGSTGITPAGAGKTLLHKTFSIFLQDHPRRCGENSFLPESLIPTSGSPPQVRGKLRTIAQSCPSLRITPAGAGKT